MKTFVPLTGKMRQGWGLVPPFFLLSLLLLIFLFKSQVESFAGPPSGGGFQLGLSFPQLFQVD